MKKLILPLSLFTITLSLLSFRNADLSGFQAAPLNANGPSGGQSGAPGEQNCTSCHSGATQNGANENLLIINNDIGFGITQYTPGATYTVNLSMASNPAKKGFQVHPLFQRALLLSMWQPIKPTTITMTTATSFISHNTYF